MYNRQVGSPRNQGSNQRNPQQQGRAGVAGQPANTPFRSTNMAYIFYNEYFEGLIEDREERGAFQLKEGSFEERNEGLVTFDFPLDDSPLKELEKHSNYRSFQLQTTYPGLMIGLGNPHDLKGKGAIKAGFSFDYVTGLPYIPGSSLKGVLRSYFPQETKDELQLTYIRSSLGAEYCDLDIEQIHELELAIFGPRLKKKDSHQGGTDTSSKEKEKTIVHKDVFLGAYPASVNAQPMRNRKLLDLEYITPHLEDEEKRISPHRSSLKNPIPINMLKVKPGVVFEFAFLLTDTILSGEKKVTVEAKLNLFETLLKDMGIGAKTNTGFSQFVARK